MPILELYQCLAVTPVCKTSLVRCSLVASGYYAHTNRDHLTTMRLLTCYFITTIMGRVSARIVSHTYSYRHKFTNYLSNAQTAFTWHDGYVCAKMDRGGADSCAFGRGGAESMTLKLTTDS